MNKKSKWLVVDLDDTLVRTDVFIEVLLRCFLTRPQVLFVCVFSCGFSLSKIKAYLAKRVPVDVSKLPYNDTVFSIIYRAKKSGKKILLATAAANVHASAIAEHLNLFDHVIASTESVNLKGERKRDEILKVVGTDTFDYIGDSMSDIPIFQEADRCYLVNPCKKLQQRSVGSSWEYEIIDQSKKSIWEYDSKILRPHQWMKNIVFFLPAFTSVGLYEYNNLWLVLPTFSLMCMFASVVYIINDIADVESDRAHKSKCNRCFASGQVSLKFGFFTAVSLLIFATTILLVWHPSTFYYFISYFSLTVIYTMFLKEIAILDIFVLICFYVLRVLIGIETLEVKYSLWFISFCVLMFGNLAFLKRYIEVNEVTHVSNPRRNYDSRDREFLRTCGITSIFSSVVLLLIYSKSTDFSEFYTNKDLFTIICLPYTLLMLRMWYLASRNEVNSDPLVHVIRSPFSYISVLVSCLILYLAR